MVPARGNPGSGFLRPRTVTPSLGAIEFATGWFSLGRTGGATPITRQAAREESSSGMVLSSARRPSATRGENSGAAAERAVSSSVCPGSPPPCGSPGQVGLCVPVRCWRWGPSESTCSCGPLPCPAAARRAVQCGVGGRRRGSGCRLFFRRWTLLARRVRSLRTPARGESPGRNHAPLPLTTPLPTSPMRRTALNPLDGARPRP